MTFKTNLALDAAEVFCNADEFGEQITYYPDGVVDAATQRVFNAIVDKGDVDALDPGGSRMLVREAVLEFPNSTDKTKGVAEINRGKDTALVVKVTGEAATLARIVRIVESDEGMHAVEIIW